jgi:hypothetical protein
MLVTTGLVTSQKFNLGTILEHYHCINLLGHKTRAMKCSRINDIFISVYTLNLEGRNQTEVIEKYDVTAIK